jgi:hypothetical protein
MLSTEKKIITLFSLLTFMVAGLSSALCAFVAATETPSSSFALQQAADKASQAVVLTGGNSKLARSGHKNPPALKQRPRSKRITATDLPIAPPLSLYAPVSVPLFTTSLEQKSCAVLQNLALQQLQSIILLI